MNEINYIHTSDVHNTTAASAFIPILLRHIQPSSVVDIGCGLGTWLKVFSDLGVKDIIGVDGLNVNADALVIPTECFIGHDLREPLILERKFDLAICLEVGEHLPEEAATSLVESLTNFSDNILFSAALLHQGGQNHINEQPFSYWVKKFNDNGFVVQDIFREEIWDNKDIDWWYRQNMFFVSKMDIANQKKINDYYHPQKLYNLDNDKNYILDKLNSTTYDLNNATYELNILKDNQMKIFDGKISTFKAIKILCKSIINLVKF